MANISITFHQDQRPAAEASRYHDIRAYRDPAKDKAYFEHTGHEHLLPQYTHLNRDLVDINLDDFYDKVFTQPLAEWNAKQKNKKQRVGKGLALPAGVSKSDAPAYAKAVRVILYEKYRWIEPGYDAISLLSDPDVYDKYEALSKAHPKAKKEYWLSQLEVYTTAKTAGEMYLGELRAGVRDGVKGAVRPSYGVILQYGSCDDPEYTEDRSDPYWQRGADMLEEALARFKHDNPNLRVIEATIHLDEAKKPPHMHVEVIPIVEQKRGRPLVASMTGALKAEGYERKDKSYDAGIDAWTRWADDQRSMMAEIAKDHGLTPVKSPRKGYGISSSRLFRLQKQIEAAAEKYAHQELLIRDAQDTLRDLDHKKITTEQELDSAKQDLAETKRTIATLKTDQATLRSSVKTLREQYQAELAKTNGAEDQLRESAKAVSDMVDHIFEWQTLGGLGLADMTEGTAKAAKDDDHLDAYITRVTEHVDHLLDKSDDFFEVYKKVLKESAEQAKTAKEAKESAEAEAKTAKAKAKAEQERADTAFTMRYTAKKKALDDREAGLDDREAGLDDREAGLDDREADLDDREADLDDREADLDDREADLAKREKALDEREEALNQEIEAKAEEKAKLKLKAKIKQVISDFKARVRYGYAEKAYDIYHYKDVRYWRSKTKDEQTEYLQDRDSYAQNCEIGMLSYDDVDQTCLSRSPVKKPYRRVRCAVHGLLKGIFGARDDAKDAGIDISGILPDGIEHDIETIEQKTYSAEKSIR